MKDRLGLLLMAGLAPREEDEFCGLMWEGRIGAAILFSRNAGQSIQAKRLCGRLHEACRSGPWRGPAIIAVDQEGGEVSRIKDGVTQFPSPSLLGGIDRPSLTKRVAWWMARELAYLGITLNLAPVADTPQGPHPPASLDTRAFGSEPSSVLRHVVAWIKGSQGAGLCACAKHFPGHGSVGQDSHIELPRDRSKVEILRRWHLVPFAGAVHARVGAVMVAHVAYEALDEGVPASQSSKCMRGLLRGELGFRGLVITDDLEMAAAGDTAEALVRSLASGADMALVGRNLRGDIPVEDLVSEIQWAFAHGLLQRDELEESLGRVEGFRRRWGLEDRSRWACEPPSVGGYCLSLVLKGMLAKASGGTHR